MACTHIVGAGLAGLSAALALTKAKRRSRCTRPARGRRPLPLLFRPRTRADDRQRQPPAAVRQPCRLRLPQGDRRDRQAGRTGQGAVSLHGPVHRPALDRAAERQQRGRRPGSGRDQSRRRKSYRGAGRRCQGSGHSSACLPKRKRRSAKSTCWSITQGSIASVRWRKLPKSSFTRCSTPTYSDC